MTHTRLTRLAVAVLLLTHVGLLGWSAWRHSPVYNEAGHLSAGLSHLRFGRFALFRVNPPLVRTLAALPLLLATTSTDWSHADPDPLTRAEHLVGLDFLQANGPRSFGLMTLARWACLPLALLGGYVCFLWARDLYGEAAGLLTLALWCFSPTVLAHAALITSDAHAASVGVAAGYAFWCWLRSPQWSSALLAGLTLGLAELCKFTLLVFYPVWLILWLLYRLPDRSKMDPLSWARQTGMFSAIVLVSLYVINAGYLFEGSLKELGSYRFQTTALTGAATLEEVPTGGHNRFLGSMLAWLPVPLPENYLQGLDTQKLDFERGRQSYLRSQWHERGWWYYHLYAWVVKLPLGTWLLIFLAAGLTILAKGYASSWRDELVLLLPAAAIFLLVSSQTGFSNHSRYTIPALPFCLVWTGKAARAFALSHRNVARVVAVGAAASIGSSLWCYPHSLAYFHEAVGGPRGGHAHLLDSNISWGQDLLYLKQWLDRHPEAAPFHLVYFGQVDPRLAGITFSLPQTRAGMLRGLGAAGDSTAEPLPGWYGIDVNHLRGSHLQAADGNGKWRSFPAGQFCYFEQLQPVATAGYSLYIYHLTLDDANRIRRQLKIPELHEPSTPGSSATARRMP